MEVENGPQKETKVIFQAPIFHFRDCCIQKGQL